MRWTVARKLTVGFGGIMALLAISAAAAL